MGAISFIHFGRRNVVFHGISSGCFRLRVKDPFFCSVLFYELIAKMYMHGCRDYKSSDRPSTMGHKLDIESV